MIIESTTCISHCVTVLGKDTVWSVLTSVPHWVGEFVCSITLDIVLGLGLYPLARRWLRRHDSGHDIASAEIIQKTANWDELCSAVSQRNP